jgi:hypothetical protein
VVCIALLSFGVARQVAQQVVQFGQRYRIAKQIIQGRIVGRIARGDLYAHQKKKRQEAEIKVRESVIRIVQVEKRTEE